MELGNPKRVQSIGSLKKVVTDDAAGTSHAGANDLTTVGLVAPTEMPASLLSPTAAEPPPPLTDEERKKRRQMRFREKIIKVVRRVIRNKFNEQLMKLRTKMATDLSKKTKDKDDAGFRDTMKSLKSMVTQNKNELSDMDPKIKEKVSQILQIENSAKF